MRDGLSVCAVGNQNESETETTNVQKTEDIDCQICHEESLKPVNVSAKEDKTGLGVQHDQGLPSRTDGAWNNTSNVSDANFRIFGPNFANIHIKGTGIDEDALYGEMNGKTLKVCLY